MSPVIRPEMPTDFAAIREVNRLAFGQEDEARLSVSVWEGATISGQGVPPERLRRESFECVSRAGERAWSFAQTMVGSGSRCVGTCGIDRCRQAGSVLPVSATGRARWAR